MTGAEVIAIVLTVPVIGAVTIPLAAMMMHHRRKMEELRIKNSHVVAADIQAEFDKLRAEIRDLRDVSMQYDLSFDTALQQVEHRLVNLEKPHHTPMQHSQEPTQESVYRSGTL